VTVLREELAEARGSRFNDVQVDPEGRVFATVMPTNAEGNDGKVLRIDPDLTVTTVISGTGIPNGMGFTQDLGGMYFTDSTARTIYRFDYDRASGALSNQRVFLKTGSDISQPDGLTTDEEGGVWSARWDGSALYRYRPDGSQAERIPFPTKKVSCPAFGGPDLTDLYVTTAGGHDKAENGATAGSLFRLRTSVRGVPDYVSRLGL
jgi:D-xylonolactonase